VSSARSSRFPWKSGLLFVGGAGFLEVGMISGAA
jgi:hypothetical protein